MRAYVSVFSCLLFSALSASEFPEAPAGAKSRKFEFTYTAILDAVPDGAKSVDVWIPVPVSTVHQTISELKFNAPQQPDIGVEPELGNTIAHWKLDAAAAKNTKLTMTFVCERKEVSAAGVENARELTPEEKTALAPWLKPNKLVLVGGDFDKVADAATKGASKPGEIARAAYDYTVSTMKYDKPKDKLGWGNGSTQWACDAHFGNCSDFHALVMSIGRTKGVPVKLEIGVALPVPDAAKPETKAGPIPGYHCWAKLYLGGVGWIPADAAEGNKNPSLTPYYFGNLSPDRVQITNGRDVNLVPRQAEGPLNFFIYPYAEADGKKITVGKTFSFADR